MPILGIVVPACAGMTVQIISWLQLRGILLLVHELSKRKVNNGPVVLKTPGALD